MKKIMILGAANYQVPIIEKAKEMDLYTIVVSRPGNYPGFDIADKSYYIDASDAEKVLEVAREEKIDAIATICTDFPMRTVAKVASNMNLPGISEKAAFMCTDKAAMRQRLNERGVPVPKYYVSKTYEEYRKALNNFSSKCVVKAPDSSGSRGIKLLTSFDNEEELKETYKYCVEFSKTGELVIEEFMEGPEVCVETLNYKGVCYPIQITDQLHKEPPYFTDSGYNQPSLLSKETQEAIKDVAIRANIALENYDGSSCTEIIVTNEGPKVVELGARLAGDCMTTHLVPISTGVNMVENVIRIALGEDIDIEHTVNNGTCMRYYMKPTIGTIKGFKGIEEVKKMNGVVEVTMLKEIGDEAVELRSSADRIGYIITKANTPEEAIKICEEAISKIEVLV